MCSSTVRNPQHSKKSSFASPVARLGCEVGSLGEHYFSHCLTAGDRHTEDLATAHSDFSKKDWLFALSLLIVISPGFAFPSCFQALWYCRLELHGVFSILGLVLMLVREEAAHGPGTKRLASLRNSHLTCIWHKCTLQFIRLLIMLISGYCAVTILLHILFFLGIVGITASVEYWWERLDESEMLWVIKQTNNPTSILLKVPINLISFLLYSQLIKDLCERAGC